MSKRFDDIARRKQALIEKAALERLELAVAYRRIHSPFNIGGKIVAVGRLLRTYPLLTAGLSSFVIGGFSKKLMTSARLLMKLGQVFLSLLLLWPKRRRRSWWPFGRR
ncbi:MAG TPA: hypothetical protein VH985_01205 [Candidatus Binatia bacterium]